MRAGPARERVAFSHPAGCQRLLLFRCSVLRIRDAVQWWCLPGPLKPSLAAVSLALPGQTAPSRHHHCPAHFAAAPPRVSSTLSERRQDLSISKGAPGSGVPVQDRVWPGMAKRRAYRDVLVACPGRAHPIPVRAFWREKSLGSCRVAKATLSRAGPAPTARSHRAWSQNVSEVVK